MPYLILRESYVTDSCVLDGLPINEIRFVLVCHVIGLFVSLIDGAITDIIQILIKGTLNYHVLCSNIRDFQNLPSHHLYHLLPSNPIGPGSQI